MRRARQHAHLGALSLLARDKVLALVRLIKHEAAIKVRPTHPIDDLLQPSLALDAGGEC